MAKEKIYVAGPLFTPGERALLDQISALAEEMGFATYLPHRDAGVFVRGETPSDFFYKNDLRQIQESAFLVAVLDGAERDSGTCWEMGYACAEGKAILGYLDDSRIYDPSLQLNPMIINSIASLSHSLAELRIAMEKYLAKP